jgi:hypothetical protein
MAAIFVLKVSSSRRRRRVSSEDQGGEMYNSTSSSTPEAESWKDAVVHDSGKGKKKST